MAGRGRGGHGRGRASMSINVEQLGFAVGEPLPGPVLQPPPIYPPMERRPVPLQSGPEVDYLLALKRDFIEFLKYSPAYVLPDTETKDIERYSDYKNQDCPNKNSSLKFDWKRFPHELRPQEEKHLRKKKKPVQANGKPPKKARKLEDISNKLEKLEEIEKQENHKVESDDDSNEKDEEKEGEAQDGEGEEEEDLDEEMDDGTDYVNNYFDNGESYLDEEDDNLDDGPIY